MKNRVKVRLEVRNEDGRIMVRPQILVNGEDITALQTVPDIKVGVRRSRLNKHGYITDTGIFRQVNDPFYALNEYGYMVVRREEISDCTKFKGWVLELWAALLEIKAEIEKLPTCKIHDIIYESGEE